MQVPDDLRGFRKRLADRAFVDSVRVRLDAGRQDRWDAALDGYRESKKRIKHAKRARKENRRANSTQAPPDDGIDREIRSAEQCCGRHERTLVELASHAASVGADAVVPAVEPAVSGIVSASDLRDLSVHEASESDAADWTTFTTSLPGATQAHDWRWRDVLSASFRQEPMYLIARTRDDRVVGVLPTMLMRSRLFGCYGVSLPFLNHGGALGLDDGIEQTLMREAAARLSARGASGVEFRDMRPRPNLPARTDKVTMILDLPSTETQLLGGLRSKVRSQVRNSLRQPHHVTVGGREQLGAFYQVYSENMRDLGTPVYTRRFFELLIQAFGDSARIVVLRVEGSPVSAGVLLRHGERMEIPWASTLRRALPAGYNMAFYHHALTLAIREGCSAFDFGRSTRGAGTHRFKRQWGSREVPLFWHSIPKRPESSRLSPDNPRYRIAIAVWQRLPLRVANRVGPLVARGLP